MLQAAKESCQGQVLPAAVCLMPKQRQLRCSRPCLLSQAPGPPVPRPGLAAVLRRTEEQESCRLGMSSSGLGWSLGAGRRGAAPCTARPQQKRRSPLGWPQLSSVCCPPAASGFLQQERVQEEDAPGAFSLVFPMPHKQLSSLEGAQALLSSVTFRVAVRSLLCLCCELLVMYHGGLSPGEMWDQNARFLI